MIINKGQSLTNAREKALLEEQKWLCENLKIVRKQRLTLKDDICYLRTLQSNLYGMFTDKHSQKHLKNDGNNSNIENAGDKTFFENTDDNSHSQNAGDADSNNFTLDEEECEIPEPVGGMNQSNIDDFNLLEERCNEMENLDLNVTPDNNPNMYNMSEYDSEEKDDEEDNPDWFNIQYDMSVVVSGQCKNFKTRGNK